MTMPNRLGQKMKERIRQLRIKRLHKKQIKAGDKFTKAREKWARLARPTWFIDPPD